ncbi:hypothetical protein G6F50_015772 [Rhizopus delemar]|uniref:Uncharacterized protein n=1 Tax=Rhizopus delemar TaxID=936053 RepID=A0A9P7C387_9FUNG|nr:hypothetical protein G6F50_015772 [Rhizopus delemar]
MCGLGCVAPLARHGDLVGVAVRHHGAHAGCHRPEGQIGRIVQREDGVAGKLREQAVPHHRQSAARVLFRRLENEMQRAPPAGVAGQMMCRAQQHGGMAVVAAAMHLAGDGRTVGGVTQLLHVQRVHVGAQADHWPLASRHRAHHAGLAQSAVNDSAGPFELPGHQVSRADFTEGGCRMRVQIAAPFAHLMQQVGADGRLDDGHGAESP